MADMIKRPIAKPFADPDIELFQHEFGLLPRQRIRLMVNRGWIVAVSEIEDSQFQPASLDLRLGARAYRVQASFLPGADRVVETQLSAMQLDELNLEGNGAILERNCVYVVPLQEALKLQDSITAVANPKSSTGRLDIFTRLITDRCEVFDQVAGGYSGQLYAEISPRSFPVRVRKGSKLNQIRFRRRNAQQMQTIGFELSDKQLREHHLYSPLVDGKNVTLRGGLILRLGLTTNPASDIVGYKAQKHTGIIDVDEVNAHDVLDFWEPIKARSNGRLILHPGEFYILASRERLHIPPELAAEMVPIDPAMGEFRVHYAGFFDPGFGWSDMGHPGSRAVLEVRSHEIPFVMEDGQVIGRLAYEKMAAKPDILYGQTPVSNYQGQGLKLSKHFRQD